ncbi:MATE family efflux transporter [Celeribacter halophilus]|uniref:MATE family efflux transporter n=1 Tax=Celeribacter halophilus TaxID=576117 RepID=A0AAW7XY50_9RHOB|nr:MATE family efflux transporter [Celeribacter halophilus]MDO6458193.1 MATE family efflux transporter [Celeribacter halophilus]MDO6724830.1 MATE family efflux transporter [Celeribacter halophilus]
MAEQIALTHRRVLKIAVPIVLSNATVPILGAVDTGVVGQLGEAAPIGAVGIGAVILASLYWVFGFLRMGTTGLVSQARGAGNAGEVAALLTRALMIGVLGGGLLILFQIPVLWAAFQVSPASPEVESLARSYIGIRIWSAPFNIALFGLTGWLIAQERTKAVLLLQLWMNGLNILLDFWFVLGLGWGVEGVAIATVLAEVTGASFGLWLCRDAFNTPLWRDWVQVFDAARLLHMLKVNTDILIRSILLLAIMVSFTFFGAGFGDLTLASNQILMQFIEITAYALDGFAFAAEAIVGLAMGAGSRKSLRRGAMLASFWGLIVSGMLALGFAVFGGAIIDAMTTAPDVRTEARRFLPWMVAAPLLGLAAWMLDGVFIGATRTRDMRNMMVLSLVVYLVAVTLLIPLWGNHGLWAALIISYIARGVTLMWKYPGLERDAAG